MARWLPSAHIHCLKNDPSINYCLQEQKQTVLYNTFQQIEHRDYTKTNNTCHCSVFALQILLLNSDFMKSM